MKANAPIFMQMNQQGCVVLCVIVGVYTGANR